MEERRKCTTVRQLELMIEFLEEHRDLALGRVRSKEARALGARLWNECAEKLNAEGPFRTGKEWSRVWNDMKCRVRAKLVNINANQRATGGGPSNASALTPLEDRVANILGRDIGPLPDVRHDHFASDNNPGPEVEEHQENILHDVPSTSAMVEEQQNILHDTQSTSIIFNVANLQNVESVTPVHVQPLPASPVPSLTGHAPSQQNTPRRTTERVRRVREQRRIERAPRMAVSTQSARTALEESRAMVLRIEEMRAEAALTSAQAMNSFAQSFKLIAESIERLSKKYCQPPQNPPM